MLTERDQQVATLPKLLFVAKRKSELADTAKIKVAGRSLKSTTPVIRVAGRAQIPSASAR